MNLTTGRKIWDLSRIADRVNTRLEHPDLFRYKGFWYCAIQESETHNQHPSTRGRVIRSADGVQWDSVELFTWDGGAAVMGGLCQTAAGRLMAGTSVYFVSRKPRFDQYRKGKQDEKSYTPPEARQAHDQPGSYYQLDWIDTVLNLPYDDLEKNVTIQTGARFTDDGVHWSSNYANDTGINTQRYFGTWHNGMGYAVGQHGKDSAGALYRTRDGITWQELLKPFSPDGRSNETALAFGDDDTGYALIRGPGTNGAMLGIGKAPYYQQWTWSEPTVIYGDEHPNLPASQALRYGLGGPRLLRLKDGRLIAAGRALGPGRDDGHASLFLVDPKQNTMTLFAEFAGTSYPAVVEHDGALHVTFVSNKCHQNVWEIHLATVPLPEQS